MLIMSQYNPNSTIVIIIIVVVMQHKRLFQILRNIIATNAQGGSIVYLAVGDTEGTESLDGGFCISKSLLVFRSVYLVFGKVYFV